MNGEATRTALAAHTRPEALDELRIEIDLTRTQAVAFGIDHDTAETQIRAALRASIRGVGTPAEALQHLRSRWVSG